MLDSEAELDLLQVLIFLWRERMPGSARESTIEPSIIQPLLTIIIASLLLALFRVDNLYLSHLTLPSQMFGRRGSRSIYWNTNESHSLHHPLSTTLPWKYEFSRGRKKLLEPKTFQDHKTYAGSLKAQFFYIQISRGSCLQMTKNVH